jgi:hypothetical protein
MESGDIPDSMREELLKRIVKETELNLPHESELIHFFEPDRIVDPVWVAKVKIPASSYEILKEEVLRKRADNAILHGALADSTSWWNPTDVILKKQYLTNSENFVNFILSKEGEDYFIYIEHVIF